MDNSTDKLRDHDCDKEGEGSNQKSEIFADVIDGSPQTLRPYSSGGSLQLARQPDSVDDMQNLLFACVSSYWPRSRPAIPIRCRIPEYRFISPITKIKYDSQPRLDGEGLR